MCDNLGAITDSWVGVDQLPRPALVTLGRDLSNTANRSARVSLLDDALARLLAQGLLNRRGHGGHRAWSRSH